MSGRLTLAAKGFPDRQIDVRFIYLAQGLKAGVLPRMGTATDVGGDGNAYALYLGLG